MKTTEKYIWLQWWTRRRGDKKKLQAGGELVQFQYGKVHSWYYYGCRVVDDNRNSRQCGIYFEEMFVPK